MQPSRVSRSCLETTAAELKKEDPPSVRRIPTSSGNVRLCGRIIPTGHRTVRRLGPTDLPFGPTGLSCAPNVLSCAPNVLSGRPIARLPKRGLPGRNGDRSRATRRRQGGAGHPRHGQRPPQSGTGRPLQGRRLLQSGTRHRLPGRPLQPEGLSPQGASGAEGAEEEAGGKRSPPKEEMKKKTVAS